MNIADVTKEIMEEAEVKVKDKKVSTEEIKVWLDEKAEKTPDEVIDPEKFGETTLVPGYEKLTFIHCAAYKITYATLKYISELKKNNLYEPNILYTQHGLYVIRGFSRREWGQLQRSIIDETKKRLELHKEQGSDQRWIEADLQMCTEEAICISGCVSPVLNKESVRQLPTGLVSHLANSILNCCGHGHEDNMTPPLSIK